MNIATGVDIPYRFEYIHDYSSSTPTKTIFRQGVIQAPNVLDWTY